MQSISPGLQAHLAGDVLQICTLIKYTRLDGVIRAYTDHDQDLTVDGITYTATGNIVPTAVETTADMSSSSMDSTGVLSVQVGDLLGITEDDVERGRYDGARVDVAIGCWSHPEYGSKHQMRAFVGDIKIHNGNYTFTYLGIQESLQKTVGRFFNVDCDAILGDSRCKVDLGPLTITASVTATDDARFTIHSPSLVIQDGWWIDGTLTWISGANAGDSCEVRDSISDAVGLWLPAYYPIQIGDTFSIYPGCNKTATRCKNIFKNFPNFRGYIAVPGQSILMWYPTAQSE